MKKSKKVHKVNYRSNDIDLPTAIDMDTLSCVLDDELERRHSYLLTERERAARLECNLAPWETEICYVQRELKIRFDRRAAHEKFIRSNPDAAFYSYTSPTTSTIDSTNAN